MQASRLELHRTFHFIGWVVSASGASPRGQFCSNRSNKLSRWASEVSLTLWKPKVIEMLMQPHQNFEAIQLARLGKFSLFYMHQALLVSYRFADHNFTNKSIVNLPVTCFIDYP